MSRTARSYPRAELIRARRAWLGSRGRPALAYVSGVSLLVTAVVVVQALLVGVDVGSMVLGVLVGGTAVGLLAFVQMGHLLSEPRANHHLRGATGEDATRDELRIARRRRLIWDWVDSLPLDRGDIDHLVITRRAGLVAIDSKYRTAATTEDIADMARSGRRTATRAAGMVRSLLERERGSHRAGGQPVEVTPVVVIWGLVGREMPVHRVVDGVHFVAGRHLRSWLRAQRSDEICSAVAADLTRRLIARRDAPDTAHQRRVKARQEPV